VAEEGELAAIPPVDEVGHADAEEADGAALVPDFVQQPARRREDVAVYVNRGLDASRADEGLEVGVAEGEGDGASGVAVALLDSRSPLSRMACQQSGDGDAGAASPRQSRRAMTYEGSPKHREPWQPGRRGSLCPREIELHEAQRLLAGSVCVGAARYATWRGQAFCAREHRTGFWHGYPVAWREVPPVVRLEWVRSRLVSKSEVRKNW